MIFSKPLLIIIFLSGFTLFGYGQQYPSDIQTQITRQQEQRRNQQEQQLIQNRLATLNGMQDRTRVSKAVFKRDSLSKEDRKSRDKLVAPETADVALFKDFLKQPATGIFRLFPDNDCLTDGVVKTDGKCKEVFPETWFYSFREKDYSDDLFFDIFLRNRKIITDSFLSQGIIVKLGNFSLDKVTLESSGAKFLNEFKPAEKAEEIKAQYEQIIRGVESDGFKYSKEVDAKVGGVYLMRVVAYHLQRKFLDNISKDEGNQENLKFFMLNQDKRDDITIAFRIIREDAGGNLTIIWKELERKKSPEVKF